MSSHKFLSYLVTALLFVSFNTAADILVYDNNSNNSYAQAGAASLGQPVTVANSGDFDTLLASQVWSVVLVDCPSTIPASGWTALIAYINGGGKVAMSFWDWDNDSGQGDPGLFTAFGFNTATSFSLTDGVDTLSAASTAAGSVVFAGNPGMPHSSWFNSWGDDGDVFTFTGGEPVAYLDFSPDPVSIVNANGNAISTFAVDEWSGPGAAEYWTGMAVYLLNAGTTPIPVLSRSGGLVLILLLSIFGLAVVRRF